jgi:hypothetical protein
MGFWTKGRAVGMLSSVVLLVGASGVQAQNVLQNPGFTGGLSPWMSLASPPSYDVAWDGAVGNGAPGAVSFNWPSSGGTAEIYIASQCAPAAGSTVYDVAGSFRYPAVVTTVPRGGIVLQSFSDPLCTISAGALSGFGLSFGGSPADTWVTQNYGRGYTTPASTVAVRVLLRVSSFSAGASIGWFDDIAIVPSALNYFTLAPCRVVDTRDVGAPIGGPVLDGQQTRTFAVTGSCGIPATARALSVNVAVTQPTSGGNVRLFPEGQAVPTVSTINYSAGQTRANNAVVVLNGANGSLSAFVGQPLATSVHLILDVNGYFE